MKLHNITGVAKDELTQFFARIIAEILSNMEISPSSFRAGSMSKRFVGSLIPNLFHIRNVIRGRDKYFERKFRDLITPAVKGMIKSMIYDHEDQMQAFLDPTFTDTFVNQFITTLVNNREQLKHFL